MVLFWDFVTAGSIEGQGEKEREREIFESRRPVHKEPMKVPVTHSLLFTRRKALISIMNVMDPPEAAHNGIQRLVQHIHLAIVVRKNGVDLRRIGTRTANGPTNAWQRDAMRIHQWQTGFALGLARKT